MKSFIWILLFLWINILHSQDINPNQVKVAYVYNFLKNITWKDESKMDRYRLLVVTDNLNVKNLFSMLASRKSLKEKNIEIVFYDQFQPNIKIHAAYIDAKHFVVYEKLFHQYESQDILLISDDYMNKKQVMINILKEKEKITFEINKANILNRGLQVSPNMILLGGTEIDVAKLYKTSQNELKKHKKTITQLNQNIRDKNAELKEKIDAIARKNLIVKKQKEDIDKQHIKLRQQNEQLKAIYKNIEEQRTKLSLEVQKVKQKETVVEALVNLQNEKNIELKNRKKDLELLNEKIRQQQKNLVQKEGLISVQKIVIITLAILVAIIIFLSLYGMKQNRLLKSLSETDALSGLYNRRFMNKKIEEEILKYRRSKTPFSILLIDVDHFKQVNDSLGHDKGDIVIKSLAKIMKNHLRRTDICARWGGEEFMVLAYNTDLNGATKLAENLRQSVENYQFNIEKKITISTGVSTFTEEHDINSIIKHADERLYKAKENGRNRVEVI